MATLYVAEAGTGGSNSTAGQCDQVAPPIGPFLDYRWLGSVKVTRFIATPLVCPWCGRFGSEAQCLPRLGTLRASCSGELGAGNPIRKINCVQHALSCLASLREIEGGYLTAFVAATHSPVAKTWTSRLSARADSPALTRPAVTALNSDQFRHRIANAM
jgi:hypothetical protein